MIGALATLGCDPPPPREYGTTAPPEVEGPLAISDIASIDGPRRVVFVTIDGVRWQDVILKRADSSLPRTRAIAAEQGVVIGGADAPCGVVRQHGESNLSLPGYLEMFTARATACTNNDCKRTELPTVLDAVRRRDGAGEHRVVGRARARSEQRKRQRANRGGCGPPQWRPRISARRGDGDARAGAPAIGQAAIPPCRSRRSR